MSTEGSLDVTRQYVAAEKVGSSMMPPQFAAGKALLRAMWMAGDFGAFSQYTESGDEKIAQQVQVHPGERILDAACGAGVFAFRAARAGAQVTGIDIAANLIEQPAPALVHRGCKSVLTKAMSKPCLMRILLLTPP